MALFLTSIPIVYLYVRGILDADAVRQTILAGKVTGPIISLAACALSFALMTYATLRLTGFLWALGRSFVADAEARHTTFRNLKRRRWPPHPLQHRPLLRQRWAALDFSLTAFLLYLLGLFIFIQLLPADKVLEVLVAINTWEMSAESARYEIPLELSAGGVPFDLAVTLRSLPIYGGLGLTLAPACLALSNLLFSGDRIMRQASGTLHLARYLRAALTALLLLPAAAVTGAVGNWLFTTAAAPEIKLTAIHCDLRDPDVFYVWAALDNQLSESFLIDNDAIELHLWPQTEGLPPENSDNVPALQLIRMRITDSQTMLPDGIHFLPPASHSWVALESVSWRQTDTAHGIFRNHPWVLCDLSLDTASVTHSLSAPRNSHQVQAPAPRPTSN